MKRHGECVLARGRAKPTSRVVLATTGMMLMLSGCANFSPDGGMSKVETAAAETLGKDIRRIRSDDDAADIEARVRAIVASGLNADKAVQIALLNNRGLQAAFAELASSEAESVEAGLPPSPIFSLARLTASIASGPAYGSVLEIERQVLVNVLSLLTLPRRRDIAEHRFKQAQLRAIESVLKAAADTRRTTSSMPAVKQDTGKVPKV